MADWFCFGRLGSVWFGVVWVVLVWMNSVMFGAVPLSSGLVGMSSVWFRAVSLSSSLVWVDSVWLGLACLFWSVGVCCWHFRLLFSSLLAASKFSFGAQDGSTLGPFWESRWAFLGTFLGAAVASSFKNSF